MTNTANTAMNAGTIKALRQNIMRPKKGLVKRLVASRTLTVSFVLALLLTAACVYIWQRVVALELIEEVSQLQETNRIRRDALMKVESDVAELSRFGRIAPLAEKRFGLKQVMPERLYAVRFGEGAAGENGMRQMWNTLRHSFKNAPSISANTAVADDLFDESEK